MRHRHHALFALSLSLVCAVSLAQQKPKGKGKGKPPPDDPLPPTSVAIPPVTPTAPAATTTAAPPPAAPATPGTKGAPSEAELTEAKELFRRGNKLMEEGQLELALAMFTQSRAKVPGVGNTLNLAIVLERLARFDASLTAYEELFRDFEQKLRDDERKAVLTAMSNLRKKVGSLDVSANVEGVVIVDGRKRGKLPLAQPLRILPGPHSVRVLQDGYAAAEATVTVAAGEVKTVDLSLAALTDAGRLSVEDESGAKDVEVIVDGAPVGTAPWTGTLGVGKHLVTLRGNEVGTAPVATTVVAGQTVAVKVRSVPIGPPVRIEPDPVTAVLILDDVVLGVGPWEGRLPQGKHTARAKEEGYDESPRSVEGDTGGTVKLTLKVDEGHPRWRKLEPVRFRLEGFLGFGVTKSMGSDAEARCPDACKKPSGPTAAMVGARGAYVLPSRVRFEASLGYLRVAGALSRLELPKRSGTGVPPYGYKLDDDLLVSGPFFAVGFGYAKPLSPGFRLNGRLSLGAFFASSRDKVAAEIVRDAQTERAFVEGSGRSVSGLDAFVMPELGVEIGKGKLHGSFGLSAMLLLLDGPAGKLGDTQAANAGACTGNPTSLACVGNDGGRKGEKHYGKMTILMPQAGIGYTF